MNNYIVLDGLRFKTPGNNWQPVLNKPASARTTLNGELNVTYGASNMTSWQGTILGPVTPTDSNWGSIDDLRAILRKNESVLVRDHLNNLGVVHLMGPFSETSISNVWDCPRNEIRVSARIYSEGSPAIFCEDDSVLAGEDGWELLR